MFFFSELWRKLLYFKKCHGYRILLLFGTAPCCHELFIEIHTIKFSVISYTVSPPKLFIKSEAQLVRGYTIGLLVMSSKPSGDLKVLFRKKKIKKYFLLDIVKVENFKPVKVFYF